MWAIDSPKRGPPTAALAVNGQVARTWPGDLGPWDCWAQVGQPSRAWCLGRSVRGALLGVGQAHYGLHVGRSAARADGPLALENAQGARLSLVVGT